MLGLTPACRIWLCTQPTDMRRSFDGLSALVRNHLAADPTSGDWYAFINRRRDQTPFRIPIAVCGDRVSLASTAGDAGTVVQTHGSSRR